MLLAVGGNRRWCYQIRPRDRREGFGVEKGQRRIRRRFAADSREHRRKRDYTMFRLNSSLNIFYLLRLPPLSPSSQIVSNFPVLSSILFSLLHQLNMVIFCFPARNWRYIISRQRYFYHPALFAFHNLINLKRILDEKDDLNYLELQKCKVTVTRIRTVFLSPPSPTPE